MPFLNVLVRIDTQVGFALPTGKLYVKDSETLLDTWAKIRDASEKCGPAAVIFKKDYYSFHTNQSVPHFLQALKAYADRAGLTLRFFVYGLATDFCVMSACVGTNVFGDGPADKTALIDYGRVYLITDAVKAVNVPGASGGPEAVKALDDAGVVMIEASEVLEMLADPNNGPTIRIGSADAHDYTCGEYAENGGPFPGRHCEEGTEDALDVRESRWTNTVYIGKREVAFPAEIFKHLGLAA